MEGDFVYNEDGSFTLYVKKESPGKELENHWLPAPDGPFFCVLRLYGPEESALDGSWVNPPLLRTNKLLNSRVDEEYNDLKWLRRNKHCSTQLLLQYFNVQAFLCRPAFLVGKAYKEMIIALIKYANSIPGRNGYLQVRFIFS